MHLFLKHYFENGMKFGDKLIAMTTPLLLIKKHPHIRIGRWEKWRGGIHNNMY
jgi:hypothetical protein